MQQTIFPYVLITTDQAVVDRAIDISENGVEAEGVVHTFLSRLDFNAVYKALSAAGEEFGVAMVAESNYKCSGSLARVMEHIN